MELINIRKQINITGKVINLLVFMLFSMMWSATIYSKTSPFLVIILGTLVVLTLGYIFVAQTRHIKQLGDTITHLCMDSPFIDPEKEDQLSEHGKHWS